MWFPEGRVRVWLYGRATDLRKSFDGLAALVKHELGEEPLSGELFVFINRRQTLMKVLYFDRGGYCVWMKRLERGQFEVRRDGARKVAIDLTALRFIVDGVDTRTVRRFRRYEHARGDRQLIDRPVP
jgi:transposase